MTKDEIVRKYLGVPFVHKGRDLKGIDCYGLLCLVYRDLGYILPDYTDYGIEDYKREWYEEGKDYYLQLYHTLWEKVEKPEPWDGLLFRHSRHTNTINHVGIYLGDEQFLHCYEGSEVGVARLDRPYWSRRLYGSFRFKGKNER